MNEDLVLLGVASDGSVEQWDGLQTPRGVLLRWFHRQDLGFPDHGYDVYRATVPDFRPLPWHEVAAAMDGQTRYEHAINGVREVTLTCEQGFRFASLGAWQLALLIPPGERVVIDFDGPFGPAWFLGVEPADGVGDGFDVEVFARGVRKDVRSLAPGETAAEWRTRGIERLVLTGDGGVANLRYQLLHTPRGWQHLKHLCLPVTHPNYPCRPAHTSSDEGEAESRLPSAVDWGRYADGFAEIHPYLRALAGREPLGSLPSSNDPDAPALGLDPASAVMLATLDPYVARIVGLAWDDHLDPFGLDGREWAYKVVGRWQREKPWTILLDSPEALERLVEAGIAAEFEGGFELGRVQGGVRVMLESNGMLRLSLEDPADRLVLGLETETGVRWRAFDDSDQVVGEDFFAPATGEPGETVFRVEAEGVGALEFLGEAEITLPGFDELRERGVEFEADEAGVTLDEAGLAARLEVGDVLRLRFPEPVDAPEFRILSPTGGTWRALDADLNPLVEGAFEPTSSASELMVASGLTRLELLGEAEIFLFSLGISRTDERTALLPSVVASDPGPPTGPGWIDASPAWFGGVGSLRADLRWELDRSQTGATPENGCIFYQVAAAQLSSDPTDPEPQPPPFNRTYLLRNGDPISVSAQAATASPSPPYYVDAGLGEGWRCWWARGVDLFGRASAPSSPDVEALVDSTAPPPPRLIAAEYVQADLPSPQASLLARSAFARAWLAAHPGQDAVVVGWAWTPESQEMCPDVDGFRLYARRPDPVASPDPLAPQETYDGVGWNPILGAEIGPIPVRFTGQITSATSGIPSLNVSAVKPVGVSAPPLASDEPQPQNVDHASCVTDLTLDAGAGALVGAVLVRGSDEYQIVGNGEGISASIVVAHPAGSPPTPGSYQIKAGTSAVATVQTDLAPPPLGADPFRRRLAGTLVSGSGRLLVLKQTGGTFVCVGTKLPAAGDEVAWYPAYVFVLDNNPRKTGFGPRPSATTPVARAQICATAVRRWATRPIESPYSEPGALAAVDTAPPPTPQLPFIPSGPYCAELATRADWYGVSRFKLSWTTQADLRYLVYRALGDAIMQLDLSAHRQGSTVTPHSFPQGVWPKEIWNDPQRRGTVQADLAALDAAIAGGDAGIIEVAYEALHADTQRLIAGQEAVREAYVALNGAPLKPEEVPYVDELDGRSEAHWFYRISSRSKSGVESAMSLPTPPICCPDVVPPEAPLVQQAVAGLTKKEVGGEKVEVEDGTVRLRWLRSPERDVARYLIYRTASEEAAVDVREMTEVARVAPTSDSTLQSGEVLPATVENQPTWLEYADSAPPGKEWFYRIVTEDKAGNRSRPSELLRGKALLPLPEPPIWNQPARTATSVSLSWTHPTDQRLACLVELRAPDGLMWQAVSGWLPRGVYAYEDTPPDLKGTWEYRLRVRDHAGQVAATFPTITLSVAP